LWYIMQASTQLSLTQCETAAEAVIAALQQQEQAEQDLQAVQEEEQQPQHQQLQQQEAELQQQLEQLQQQIRQQQQSIEGDSRKGAGTSRYAMGSSRSIIWSKIRNCSSTSAEKHAETPQLCQQAEYRTPHRTHCAMVLLFLRLCTQAKDTNEKHRAIMHGNIHHLLLSGRCACCMMLKLLLLLLRVGMSCRARQTQQHGEDAAEVVDLAAAGEAAQEGRQRSKRRKH
jgi:hypothetical protein